MTEHEYYADQYHLDTDDHQRLIEENRAAYAREEAARLAQERADIEAALRVVGDENERQRLTARAVEADRELAFIRRELRRSR